MQRLVEVELWHCDVVLEPALHRFPSRVNRTEGCIAVAHRVDDNAHADEVVDVLELEVVDHHLSVDRIEMLLATIHVAGDVEFSQTLFDFADELGDVQVSFRCSDCDHRVELCVLLGHRCGEGQVFESLLQFLHAQPVSEWRIDVESFASCALLLPRRHGRDRLHIVEAIGQLDDEHPCVLGNCEHHLSHRRGLLGFLAIEVHPVEFGDAVDNASGSFAEVSAEFFKRQRGVLDSVVKQSCSDRNVVESKLGDYFRHR